MTLIALYTLTDEALDVLGLALDIVINTEALYYPHHIDIADDMLRRIEREQTRRKDQQ